MDTTRVSRLESLAQKMIINMVHFTKPEFRQSASDQDSWIGCVESVTKALPIMLELYGEVFSEEILAKLEEKENAVLRRGYFRTMLDASGTLTSVIDQILKKTEIELYLSRVSGLARELQNGIAGITRRRQAMAELAKARPDDSLPVREIEKLYEGLKELDADLDQLSRSLADCAKLTGALKKQAGKNLKRLSRNRAKQKA